MPRRLILLALLVIAASCGDDDDASDDAGPASEATAGTSGRTSTGGSGRGGSSGNPSTGAGNGGSASGTAGTQSPTAGDGGGAQPPAGGMPPQNGAQFSYCESDEDCMGGLNCYEFGRYCSTPCAEDGDCAALGSDYGCSGAGGFTGGGGPGGGFPGGGAMGDAGATQADGVCRATCDGADDTSCPSGMMCMSASGGFMGGPGGGFPGGGGDGGAMTSGTFRCGYEEQAADPADPGADPNAGMAGAFEACAADEDCGDGLNCTAFGGGNGYCAQMCMEDADCTSAPGSGSPEPSCSFGNLCTLSCSQDADECPDGMTCVPGFGGGGFMGGGFMGGGGSAFCNYSN